MLVKRFNEDPAGAAALADGRTVSADEAARLVTQAERDLKDARAPVRNRISIPPPPRMPAPPPSAAAKRK